MTGRAPSDTINLTEQAFAIECVLDMANGLKLSRERMGMYRSVNRLAVALV